MKIHASFGVVLLTLSLALSAWAAPPLFINYQGVLVDGGEPLEDGIYTLTFEIYDDEVGGTMLWWGEYDVEVTSGVFGVLLGESPYPLDIYDFEEYETWIEVQIGSMALTFPRQQMTFVPYCFHSLEALQSDEADLAHDLNCPGCVGAGDIATGAVTEDELADDAVTTDKIADAAVVASKIDKAAVGAYHIDHNAVTANHVDFNYAGSSSEGGAATIASDLACTGCVNATDIGANAVASSEIATGAVNEDEINLPLIFAYSKLNGGIITVENTADGSSGNYPAAFSGSASGSPSSFRVIGLLGSTPPLGSNPAHNLLPMGALGVAGASGTGYGVAGTSDTGYGVYGYSNDKNGVHGVSLGSLADNGVYGETDSTDSTEGGVKGVNTSAGTGVYGLSESGYGVRGGSTSGIGIYGSSLDSHGISGSTSEATYSGVRGYTYTAGAYGVTGKSYSSGAAGFFEGTSGPGVKAESAGTGLADSTITAENTGGGIAFWAKTDSTDIAAAFSNEGTGALIKGFGDDGGGHEFIVQNDGSVWTEGDIGADGDIQTDGRLYTGASPPTADYSGGTYTMSLGDIGTSDDVIVDDDIIVGGDARIDGTIYGGDGGLATMVEVDGVVRTFHVDESAQDMLSDRGSGRLIAGEATILLDPAYADSIRIDNARPLLVQLTPTSECMGLYVYATSGDGFTVRELAGGDSDATFDWEVSAFRKGGIMGRMPSATANLATVIAD